MRNAIVPELLRHLKIYALCSEIQKAEEDSVNHVKICYFRVKIFIERLVEINFSNIFKLCLLNFNISDRVFRSSCLKVFCQKVALNNFAKFTGKHLHRSLAFSKVVGCFL